jgi:methyl-accepting chemotaxis protein
MENYLPVFVGVTAAAVVLQALILVAMYLALRRTSTRIDALSTEVSAKVLPTAELAHSMLVDLRPKIEAAVTNVSETTTMVRSQMQRLDATVNDAIDRARLQVIRADELVNRTLDQVEETAEIVHDTVVSPVRQLSGLIHGLSAGISALLGRRRGPGNGVTVPQDEMFI